jgi:hypothetical protein
MDASGTESEDEGFPMKSQDFKFWAQKNVTFLLFKSFSEIRSLGHQRLGTSPATRGPRRPTQKYRASRGGLAGGCHQTFQHGDLIEARFTTGRLLSKFSNYFFHWSPGLGSVGLMVPMASGSDPLPKKN